MRTTDTEVKETVRTNLKFPIASLGKDSNASDLLLTVRVCRN